MVLYAILLRRQSLLSSSLRKVCHKLPIVSETKQMMFFFLEPMPIGFVQLALYIAAAGSATERALSALSIFNLTTSGGAVAADALLAADTITALRPLLLEPGVTCLAATMAAAHLVRHVARSKGGGGGRRRSADVEKEAEPSILAFSDRWLRIPSDQAK